MTTLPRSHAVSIRIPTLIVTSLTIALAGAFWWATDRNEGLAAKESAEVTAREVRSRLESDLNSMINESRMIEALWAHRSEVEASEFHAAASVAYERRPELQAINWVNSKGVIQWIYPELPNAAALGKDLRANPMAGPIFERVQQEQQPHATPPIQLYQGHLGVAAYFPILGDGRSRGYLNVVMRVESVIENCIHTENSGLFDFEFYDGGQSFYPPSLSQSIDSSTAQDIDYQYSFKIVDRDWTIVIRPTDAIADLTHSYGNDVLSILAILLGLSLGFATDRLLASRQSLHEHVARSEREQRDRELFLRRIIDTIPNLVFVKDADGRFTLVNKALENAFGAQQDDIIGKTDADFNPNVEEVESFRRMDLQVLHTGADQYIPEEVLTDSEDNIHWLHTIKRAILNDDGNPTHVLGVCTDITERKIAEERQALLMRELDHRVKNNLAALLALTKQTLARATSLEQFEASFVGRVTALTRSHDALARAKWEGFNLSECASLILDAFSDHEHDRFTLRGEDMTLPAAAATPVSMVLHELATNAVKYGALSLPHGTVDLSWEATEETVTIVWRELGGPAVTPPSREGIGSQLIRGFIEYELRGSVDVDYRPEGLVCTLSLPLRHRAQAAQRTAAMH